MSATQFWDKHWPDNNLVSLDFFIKTFCDHFNLNHEKDPLWLIGAQTSRRNLSEEDLAYLHKSKGAGLFIYVKEDKETFICRPHFEWIAQHIHFNKILDPYVVKKIHNVYTSRVLTIFLKLLFIAILIGGSGLTCFFMVYNATSFYSGKSFIFVLVISVLFFAMVGILPLKAAEALERDRVRAIKMNEFYI